MAARLDDLQRRVPAASFPLAVVYKFYDDQGSYLAALIAYYGLISLFPLLLLSTSILGFVLQGHPSLETRVLHSALADFPVIGSDLDKPHSLGGSGIGLTIGIIGAVYGGLGVAQAGQNAMNIAWAVPRNSRPNPLKARLRSLQLLASVGFGVVITTSIFALASGLANFGSGMRILLNIVSVVLNAGIFMFAFRIATARPQSAREIAPGAITAALIWQLLQMFGAAYVRHVVDHATETDGTFALVLGLIGFLYLEAIAVVLGVELNVVRAKRLYPRSLLTPFTDDVELTEGDRRAYTDAAKAQRNKGFQRIHVTFDRSRRRKPPD